MKTGEYPLNKIITQIKKYRRFIILSHVSPEGDSIGSQLALKSLLERAGKSAEIINESLPPANFRFLPGTREIRRRPLRRKNYEATFVLDCSALERTGRVASYVDGTKPLINIDHHLGNSLFGTTNWVDVNSSSAGEMIFQLSKKMKLKLNRAEALCLYVAILTDTGSFHYVNTSPATHRVVAELLKHGIKTHLIFRKSFQEKTFSSRRLLGITLSRIKRAACGKIVWMEVTPALLKKAGAGPSDAEGFINYLMETRGVEVGLIFSKLGKRDRVKVNFRSRGKINVNTIARRFGGGGHRLASGCLMEGNIPEVERKVLREVERAV